MPSPAVEISGLVKVYGGARAVDDLSLTADAGRVTAVLGPNGAGKTTTIECCEGLRSPDAGRVRVLGLDPVRDSPALRARVGVMLQDGGLPAAAPALDVLRHVSAMYAAPRDLGELSTRLGLTAFARTPVRRLSGGQRQRLALAAAVVGRPELVFLDEPGAGLDPQGRHAVWQLVSDLRQTGVSVVLTTHLMDEAETLADDVVIVDRGQVIAHGSPAGLVADRAGNGTAVRFTGPTGLGASLERDLGHALVVHEARTGVYRATALPSGENETRRPGDGERTDPRTVARLIATLTTWAADRDLLLTGFTLGPKTLEDVFLELTGRELR